jgi:hypothetical protein
LLYRTRFSFLFSRSNLFNPYRIKLFNQRATGCCSFFPLFRVHKIEDLWSLPLQTFPDVNRELVWQYVCICGSSTNVKAFL